MVAVKAAIGLPWFPQIQFIAVSESLMAILVQEQLALQHRAEVIQSRSLHELTVEPVIARLNPGADEVSFQRFPKEWSVEQRNAAHVEHRIPGIKPMMRTHAHRARMEMVMRIRVHVAAGEIRAFKSEALILPHGYR